MSMATLYQIGENGSLAEQWEVGEEPVLVGRKGHAQGSIEDEGVSRRHFVISRDGEDYVIKDLNSRNGTWVEGRRVSAEKLRHNDCIQAGRTLFRFAEPPIESAPISELPAGPHGTVIIPPLPCWNAAREHLSCGRRTLAIRTLRRRPEPTARPWRITVLNYFDSRAIFASRNIRSSASLSRNVCFIRKSSLADANGMGTPSMVNT